MKKMIYYNCRKILSVLKEGIMELSFGRMLKVLRVYNSETTIDMAKKLDISLSYLSAIENGKRKIPNDFLDKLFKVYSIKEEEKEAFKKAYELAQNEAIINMANMGKEQKEFALLCARSIEGLSEKQMEEIRKIILNK